MLTTRYRTAHHLLSHVLCLASQSTFSLSFPFLHRHNSSPRLINISSSSSLLLSSPHAVELPDAAHAPPPVSPPPRGGVRGPVQRPPRPPPPLPRPQRGAWARTLAPRTRGGAGGGGEGGIRLSTRQDTVEGGMRYRQDVVGRREG